MSASPKEAADVLYHLSVLLASRSLTPGRRRSGCSMSAVARQARAPSRSRETWIDDTETPVSAFLKLRAAGAGEPCFLLESADHGRVGRYSFIGYRPRKVVRWSLGDPGDPYELAQRELDAARGAPRPSLRCRSPAAPSACSPTTWCARSSRSAIPTRTRSACPTWR